MDPLSAIASVAGIVDMVTKTVLYLRGVKNAPKERRQVLEKVDGMKRRLDELQLFIIEKDTGSGAVWLSDLESMEKSEHILQQCSRAILDLNNKLYPIEKHGIQKWWQALTWNLDKDDVRILIEDIHHANDGIDRMLQKAQINLELRTADAVERIDIRAENREFIELLDWICPVSYHKQLQDILDKIQGHPGQWYLQSTEYVNWAKATHSTVLYCPGHQGCGKTVIASLVIRDLQQKLQNGHVAAFFYCDHKRQDEQDIVHFVLSLIRQLVANQGSPHEQLAKLWEKHQKTKTKMTSEEAQDLLKTLLMIPDRVYVVVDALDEASDHSSNVQKQLIDLLWALRQSHKINFLVTSRELPHLEEFFRVNSMVKRISANSSNIEAYLIGRVSEFSRSIQKKPDLVKKAVQRIVEVCNDRFLLAQLLMKSLTESAETARDLSKKLENISTSTYESAYREAMERINGQTVGKCTQAIAALKWIVRARTLLSPASLQRALAIDIGDEEYNPEGQPEIEDILAVCQGLLIVDGQSDVIRLVHKTAHEYLHANHLIWLPGADLLLAQTCLTYCSFRRGPEALDFIRDPWQEMDDALLAYTFHCCGGHALDVDSSGDERDVRTLAALAIETFDRGPGPAMSWIVLYTDSRSRLGAELDDPERRIVAGMTAWHFFARFNLILLFELSLEGSQQTFWANESGDTPLHYAARFKATGIVPLILRSDHCQVNSRNMDDRTPLSEAAASGNPEIIRLLLQTSASEINSQDTNGNTPLMLAVRYHHLNAVTLLLEAHGDPNIPDKDMISPLLYATECDIARALLKFGALPTAKDAKGHNALHIAVAQEPLTPQLEASPPSQAAHVERIRQNCSSVFSWVIRATRRILGGLGTELVEVLLDSGVDVNDRDSCGQTPLHRAVENSDFQVAVCLMSHNADTTLEDDRQETFLTLALTKEKVNTPSANLLLSTLRKTSTNFSREVQNCYERLAQRATAAWDRMKSNETSEVCQTPGALSRSTHLKANSVFSNDPEYSSPVRVFELALFGCLFLEHFASDVIKQEQKIGGIPAREHDTSVFSPNRGQFCHQCSEPCGSHVLCCFDSCSESTGFDICSKCVSIGKWCHNKKHRLQELSFGQFCFNEAAPWRNYQESRPVAGD